MNTTNLDQTTLSIEKVAEILCYKDTRQIKEMMENGTIPRICFNSKNLSFKAKELIDFLGIEDFNENFIIREEAKEFLGDKIPKKQLLTSEFCKNKGIPFIKLSNNKGSKILFRKSLLTIWAQESFPMLDEDLYWVEGVARKEIINKFNNFLEKYISYFSYLSKEKKDIINLYIKGFSLNEISERVGLTPAKVRQIFNKVYNKLIEHFDIFAKFFEESQKIEFYNNFSYFISNPLMLLEDYKALIDKKEELENEIGELKRRYDQLVSLNDKILSKEQKDLLKVVKEAHNKKIDKDLYLYMSKLLKTSSQDLDLPVRALNCLKAYNIRTLGELVSFDIDDFLKFKNFGKKTLSKLDDFLRGKGLNFGMDVSLYDLDS